MLEFVEVEHPPAVSQLGRPHPALHDVYVHDPVIPPTEPPLMQKKVPSEPSFGDDVETAQGFFLQSTSPRSVARRGTMM